jgi:hypothetical protein
MYIQGASLARAIRPTSQFKSICLAYALGRPCRDPNVVIDDGQVEVPNSQRISCLDSSLGRVAVCGAGGRRFAPLPRHVCLGALLEDRDDPGQVSLYVLSF